MKSSVSGFTAAAVALAAGVSLTLNGPHRAYAQPGAPVSQSESDLAVTVLSPTPRTSFSGTKPVEISAFYQGGQSNQIVAIELYVDGANAFTKKLDAPESRGVISFLVDASQLSAGTHRIVIRAVAADAEVVSAKSSFIYIDDKAGETEIAPATNTVSGAAPQMLFVSPAPGEKVQGTVHVELQPVEGSPQSPYVSVFVDGQFKTMRNYAPYTYDWDTTGLSNGLHTIEIYAYDDNQKVGPSKSIKVYVNNPGGETGIRTDLHDGKAGVKTRTGANTPELSDDPANPLIPGRTMPKSFGHRPVATLPIDRKVGSSVLPPRTYKSGATQATASGQKAIGPFRRPTPRMAMVERKRQLAELRSILLSKRPDLLDQTGGLDLSSQLSDPFIPDTATRRPAATPVTGYKPLPATVRKTNPVSPSVLAAHTGTPAVTAPVRVETQVPVAAPVEIKTAHPVAKPIRVQAQHPVAAPAHVKVAHPVTSPATVAVAHPATAPVHVQAAVPAAKPAKVQTHTPKSTAPASAPVLALTGGAMHTAAPSAPATIEVHTPTSIERSDETVLVAPSIPATALHPAHVNVAAPVAKPAHVNVAAPVAKPAHVDVVAPIAKPAKVNVAHPMTAKPIEIALPVQHQTVAAVHPATAKPVTMARITRPITVETVKHITTKPIRVATSPARNRASRISVATPMRIVGSHRVQIMMGGSNLMRARGLSSVFYNNIHLKLDRPIMTRHGVAYMPLRQVFEFQGSDLTWDAKTQTVHAVSETSEMTLQIGKRQAAVNKAAVKMDGAPFVVNGRTMVPISFVQRALNVDVAVDPVTGNVQFNSRA